MVAAVEHARRLHIIQVGVRVNLPADGTLVGVVVSSGLKATADAAAVAPSCRDARHPAQLQVTAFRTAASDSDGCLASSLSCTSKRESSWTSTHQRRQGPLRPPDGKNRRQLGGAEDLQAKVRYECTWNRLCFQRATPVGELIPRRGERVHCNAVDNVVNLGRHEESVAVAAAV